MPPLGSTAAGAGGAGGVSGLSGLSGSAHRPHGLSDEDGIFKTVAVYFRVLGIFDTVDEAKSLGSSLAR